MCDRSAVCSSDAIARYDAADPPAGAKSTFTCTYRDGDSHGIEHYHDCYQGSPRARAHYEMDEESGPGDFVQGL